MPEYNDIIPSFKSIYFNCNLCKHYFNKISTLIQYVYVTVWSKINSHIIPSIKLNNSQYNLFMLKGKAMHTCFKYCVYVVSAYLDYFNLRKSSSWD